GLAAEQAAARRQGLGLREDVAEARPEPERADSERAVWALGIDAARVLRLGVDEQRAELQAGRLEVRHVERRGRDGSLASRQQADLERVAAGLEGEAIRRHEP